MPSGSRTRTLIQLHETHQRLAEINDLKGDLPEILNEQENEFNEINNTQSNNTTKIDNLSKEYIRIQLSELEESRIDWMSYINDGTVNLRAKKELRDHQIQALNDVREGLEKEDRGKLIMACGTGKTFTSLKIAEHLAGEGEMVLYMVPSLSLMSQTIREWKNDCSNEFLAFSVCSDQKVGKKKSSNDLIEITLNELAFPATTDSKKLSEKIQRADKSKMIVIFSTYHSIDVITKSQYEFNLNEFDLIICDASETVNPAKTTSPMF